jgi:hypothetical protein
MFKKGDLIKVNSRLQCYPFFDVYPGKNVEPIDMKGFIRKDETILVVKVSTNKRKEKVLKCLRDAQYIYISDITESETTSYNLDVNFCLEKVE